MRNTTQCILNKSFFLALSALLLSTVVSAQQLKEFGDYEIHYVAITNDTVPANIASQYGLSRSKSRAFVNITVLKKSAGERPKPSLATVSGRAQNLTGQMRELSFRKVEEQEAIYYISEFPVTNQESFDFKISVVAKGATKPMAFSFRQKFYTQ